MKRNAFIFLLFAAATAVGQEDTLRLLPVEVRSIRASEKAPFTKTDLDKAFIQGRNLGQDIPFILQSTPSVVVNSDAGNGIGYTGIRIRGTDATRINVTLNGIPFNDPESGGAFFVNLPDLLSSVNSIQVQRGVGTSSNGGSAFGATINLGTHEAAPQKALELSNSVGSFRTLKNTIKFTSGLVKNRFLIDARLSQIRSDGYIDRSGTNLRSFYLSTAWLHARTGLRFTTFSGKEVTDQAWYGVSAEDLRTNRRANSAGTEKPGLPYDNETDNYTQTHYQLFLDRKLTPHLVFNTGLFLVRGKGYYEQYKAGEKYSDYGLPDGQSAGQTIALTDLVRQLWLDNYYYGDIFSLIYQKGRTLLTAGGTLSNYTGQHYGLVPWAAQGLPGGRPRWYDNDASKSDVSFYSKWQQSLTPHLALYADAQWRSVGYQLDGFRNNPSLSLNNRYQFLNPKLGISYTKDRWFASASYAIGNKEPNRDDFETGLNEQPRAERLKDLEMRVGQKTTGFQWAATGYFMDYRDQLVLTGKINDVGAYTRTNIPKSYRAGIELEAAAPVRHWLGASGNLTLSRNKMGRFTDFIDDYDSGTQKGTEYAKTDISFSPSLVGSATLTIVPTERASILLVSKYVSSQYLDNTSNPGRRLEAYFTQDISARYSFSAKGFKILSLTAGVNNILNSMYEPNGYTFSYYANARLMTENYYFPMAGANWMVGLQVKL